VILFSLISSSMTKPSLITLALVIRCSEKQIVTIEGNTSGGAKDQRNGGEVMVKSRALGARSFVVGYGRPTYEPFSGELPERPKGENNGTSKSNCWHHGLEAQLAGALAVYMAGGDIKAMAMGWRGSCCASHFALAQSS
jgi:hypothetical protein